MGISHQGKRATVLVVDDESDIARAIAMRLCSAGYEVLTAKDAREALRLAVSDSPDLLILDLGLPDQDGHAVAHQMLADTRTMATPIIFLTARYGDEDRARAFKSGAVAYLNKPFQSDELLQAVSRAVTVSSQMRCRDRLHH
jgi:two-component system KDP operon response regulator KdpE